MTSGRTVLCVKDPTKGNVADNFRPITCLPFMWKLTAGIIAESTHWSLEGNMIQVTEQTLVDQANQIQKNKWLSDIELEEINRNIEDIPHDEAMPVNEHRVETEGMDEQEHSHMVMINSKNVTAFLTA